MGPRFAGLLVVLVLAACGVGPSAEAPTAAPAPVIASMSCADEAAPFLAQIQPLAREWDDANRLASSTPRASLAPQIDKLQALRRKAEDLEAPDCAAGIKQPLVATMETTTQAFIAFLGQQAEDDVSALFAVATEQHGLFDAAMLQLKDGKPISIAEPIFHGGIGIDRATIQKAYPAYTFEPIGTDPNLFMGMVKEDSIGMAGPADNIRVASMILIMAGSSGDRLKNITQELHAFLKLITPDWNDGDAWLTTAMQQDSKQMVATRGRVVSYERVRSGNDTFSLIIRAP